MSSNLIFLDKFCMPILFNFIILSCIGLSASTFVVVSSNPVFSILFLVLTFLTFSLNILLFGLEFFTILFVIIYVGAISILFIFVIFMLEIKSTHKINDKNNFLFPVILMLFSIYLLINNNFIIKYFDLYYEYWFNFIDPTTNIEILGQVLFYDYSLYILLSGILLLISLFGCIVLTLKFDSNSHYQIISKQIARDLNFSIFFIR